MILHLLWISPLCGLLLLRTHPLLALALVMASHGLVLYPTLRPTSQWLGPVVTSFRTAEREVWLTIDDGPSAETTRTLDLLDQFGARATWFVIGRQARDFPEEIAELVRRGHSVGNHSHTHPSASFWALPPGRIQREIDECSEALRELTGSEPKWFRAPVGMKNPFVHPAAQRRRLAIVGWSARGYDAVSADDRMVVERILRDLRPGAIIMAHERSQAGSSVLELLLRRVTEAGYRFVVPSDDQLLCGRRAMIR